MGRIKEQMEKNRTDRNTYHEKKEEIIRTNEL